MEVKSYIVKLCSITLFTSSHLLSDGLFTKEPPLCSTCSHLHEKFSFGFYVLYHRVCMCAYFSIFLLFGIRRSSNLILFTECFQYSPNEHQASSFLMSSVQPICVSKDYLLFLASVLNAQIKDLQQLTAMKYQQVWNISCKIKSE